MFPPAQVLARRSPEDVPKRIAHFDRNLRAVCEDRRGMAPASPSLLVHLPYHTIHLCPTPLMAKVRARDSRTDVEGRD
ncbi:hypothetical protein MTO96_012798 [Rhipicephalus appendiculatus]